MENKGGAVLRSRNIQQNFYPMKNLSITMAVMFTVMLFSCSKESQNVTPASLNSLAMVIPKENITSTTNLLLLKDGRTANPTSGIPNFNTMKVGDKLSLSFKTSSVHNGVVDIDVTKFTLAQDSVFIPGPPSIDTTSFTGTYSCLVYKRSAHQNNTSNTVDTTIVASSTSISFNASNYACSGIVNGYPAAGHGTFVTSHGTFTWLGTITFTDSSSNSDTVLNGPFNYFISTTNLICLYATRNDVFYSLYLRRN